MPFCRILILEERRERKYCIFTALRRWRGRLEVEVGSGRPWDAAAGVKTTEHSGIAIFPK